MKINYFKFLSIMLLLFLFIGGVSASNELNDTLKSNIDDVNELNFNENVNMQLMDDNQVLLENNNVSTVSFPEDNSYAGDNSHDSLGNSEKYSSWVLVESIKDTTYPGYADFDVYAVNATTLSILVFSNDFEIIYNDTSVINKSNYQANVSLSNLSAGGYLVLVTNYETDEYEASEDYVKFTVLKADPYFDAYIPWDIKAHDEGVVIEITSIGNVSGKVMLSIDDEIISQMGYDLVNGSVNISIPSDLLSAGRHSYVVGYPGDDNYNVDVDFGSFIVAKRTTEANITTPEGFKINEEADIVVTIPNATGDVNIIVDGIENIVHLDENGSAAVTINVTAGEHSIVAVYPGDDIYDSILKTATFNAEVISSKFDNVTVDNDLNIVAVLVNAMGDAIANATITYTIGSTSNTTMTDDNGVFTMQGVPGEIITIEYVGDNAILPTSISLSLKNIVPVFAETHFNITGGVITLTGYAVDTKAGEEGMSYATELLDASGRPINGVQIKFAVNDKIYARTTNENGSFTPYKLNMVRAGRYTMAFYFAGDDNYLSTFASACIDLDKKPITIKASAKTYKASATKSYTVALSTKPCSSADGKAYLSPKKVTLKVNGKTYSGKTDDNGQVTFKLTNLSNKGVYTAVIDFAGDATYESASKSVKITIN